MTATQCPECLTVNVRQESRGLTDDLNLRVGFYCLRGECGHTWEETAPIPLNRSPTE